MNFYHYSPNNICMYVSKTIYHCRFIGLMVLNNNNTSMRIKPAIKHWKTSGIKRITFQLVN